MPNPEPVIVTEAPTGAEAGVRLAILTANTVKFAPLLESPFTVTTMFPVVAPEGTVTTILVSLQLEGVADVPFNVTVLEPWVAPNPLPLMVTEAPTAPAAGDRAEIAGGGCVTVKGELV